MGQEMLSFGNISLFDSLWGVHDFEQKTVVVGLDPETRSRLEPPNGAKLKWARQRLQLPHTPEPRRQLPGAGAQPVGFGDGRCTFRITRPTYPGPGQRRPNADRFAFGLPTPAHLSSDKQLLGVGAQLPGVGAQSGFDRFKDGLPNMTGSE